MSDRSNKMSKEMAKKQKQQLPINGVSKQLVFLIQF